MNSSTAPGQTMFVSLTRLRIRSVRFLPGFAWHAIRTRSQCARAAGFLRGALLPDRKWTFWTLTLWDSEASMRAYILSGDHKVAMPKLMHWCDQASVAHWNAASEAVPDWTEADRRMRSEGRPSKVRFPAAGHQDLTYASPRTSASAPIARST
ncbi:MAG: DUF3291 domain-containing protein [Janthinobacterium lividum]